MSVLATIGTVITAISAIASASQKARAARYNAAISSLYAEQAKRQGEITKYRLERQRKAMLGRQKALYAKAGVELSGSPLEVLADTEAQYELDKQLAAYNTEVDRTRYLYGARNYNDMAKSIMTQGFLNAGGTLLTSGVKGYKSPAKYGTYKYWHNRGLAYRTPRGFDSSFAKSIGLGA